MRPDPYRHFWRIARRIDLAIACFVDQYCCRYIESMRGKGEINTGTGYLGFRV